MASKERRRKKQCAYCGQIKPATRDHVIPKCLFLRPLPNNMITVPACDECNGKKSRHDDFLLDILVTDIYGANSPTAQQIFRNKTIRSNQQDKSLLSRIALDQSTTIPVQNEHGQIDVGHTFTVDEERINEMFAFVIRGLYFSFRSIILPNDCKFEISRLFHKDLNASINAFKEMGVNGPYKLGDDIFTCVYNYGENQEMVTFWFLEFYGRVHYTIITTPQGFKSD